MLLEDKELIRFEDYVIDRSGWTLTWRSEPIALSRKSFDLLLFLLDHRDRVVSKDNLLQALWPDQFVEESNLTQHVFLLRKALSRHESKKKIIETIPGRGYRFTATVAVERPETPPRILFNASESITQITIEEEEIDSDDHLSITQQALGSADTHGLLPKILAIAAVPLLGIVCWLGWQHWQNHMGGAPVQVVLVPTEGTTGDPVLDRALVASLRMNLSQSPFVSLVPASMVNSTLAEMKQKLNDPMSAAVAREVCERTNSQAVLRGQVARNGQHYLLTEEATSCVDGSILAATKEEASRPEDLPRSLDRLAESLRQKLGESRRSIARFSVPLAPATTASLEALKAYAESLRMAEQGKLPDAINLLKEAVAADPNFAVAYNDLWAYYATSSGDPMAARAAITKAYSLRDSAGPLERLTITSHYNMVIVGDLFESERNYQSWAQLYPRSIVAWNGLTLTQGELGQNTDAAISAARALSLRPTYAGLYGNLVLAQLHIGDLQAARATCESALARGIDGEHLRSDYLMVAYLLHDSGLLKAQRDWAVAHPKTSYVTLTDASIAIEEGRFADARQLFSHAADVMRQQGLESLVDSSTRSIGISLIEAGDVTDGSSRLRATPPDPESGSDLVGLAEIGDLGAASAGLHAMQAAHPQSTLWKMYWGPMIQAEMAMKNKRPEDAVAILEPTHLLDARGLDLPSRRGNAYLAAGQPGMAEKEYRYVLAHQQLDPTSYYFPLAWLGLGRSLAAEGDRAGALDAYRHFLELWSHADADAEFLIQARRELATLQQVSSKK
jgi:DNA-binding winged helix-turn-helix (wHTH) protein/tetratricopeptide (TPR) repeat protein